MTQTKTIADRGSTPLGSTTIGDIMINILKKIFGIKTEKVEPVSKDYYQNVYNNHDMVDYDGMGNQGRFPVKSNGR